MMHYICPFVLQTTLHFYRNQNDYYVTFGHKSQHRIGQNKSWIGNIIRVKVRILIYITRD